MTDTATVKAPTDQRDIRRVVAADDDIDRRIAQPVTMTQMFLRFDATHEAPHIVETERGDLIARFRHAGDLAIFVAVDRKTLPAAYVRQYTGGQ